MLLEAHLKRDLILGDHISYGEKAVIPNIKNKLRTLWLVSKNLQKESRLRLVNGVITYRVLYVIQVWGSTKPKWIKKMQRTQNTAAWYVCRAKRYAKIEHSLKECKWISIQQLIVHHSLVMMYKTIIERLEMN